MRSATSAAALALIVFGLVFCRGDRTAAVKMPGSLDSDLYLAVIARMKAGEPYYAALGREQQARDYPTRPVFAWRLPTLLTMEAGLPSLGWSIALLSLIGAAAAALWWRHFRIRHWRAAVVSLPLVISALPLWAWLAPRDVTLHDLWAGQLISLSLACWASERRRLSVAAGAGALAIRELALPFVLVMSATAWLDRRRGESLAWMGVAAAFGAGLVWHAFRVAANIPPGGYANSWVAGGGWCFALATARANVLVLLLPSWCLSIVVPLMLLAVSRWESPVGRRVAAVVAAYVLMFTVVGRPFNWYWGLLIAPILAMGVVALVSKMPPPPTPDRSISSL